MTITVLVCALIFILCNFSYYNTIVLFSERTYSFLDGLTCRFTLPPYLTLKNFEGLDLGKMDKVSDICPINLNFNYRFTLPVCSPNGGIIFQTDDSGLASYVAGQVDQSLSWKVSLFFFFFFLKCNTETFYQILFVANKSGCKVASDNHFLAYSS